MAQTVYIETTIVSYLTAWPSRDLIRAAQQKITHDWWNHQRGRFDILTSELVVIEASSGDPAAASDRLKALQSIRALSINAQSLDIADTLIAAAALPSIALRDAQHVGICATNGIDYLLTWNCTHLANATLRDRIEDVCNGFGLRAPIICTPEELLGELP